MFELYIAQMALLVMNLIHIKWYNKMAAGLVPEDNHVLELLDYKVALIVIVANLIPIIGLVAGIFYFCVFVHFSVDIQKKYGNKTHFFNKLRAKLNQPF